MNYTSCIGCKFLYSQGEGYSNWTWLDTSVKCAKDKNPNLPMNEPSDWKKEDDNWPATNKSRCSLYQPGSYVELDIDGENYPQDFTNDEEAILAIASHSGRTNY